MPPTPISPNGKSRKKTGGSSGKESRPVKRKKQAAIPGGIYAEEAGGGPGQAYRMMLESLQEGVVYLSPSLEVRWLNRAAANLVKVKKSSGVQGRVCSDVFSRPGLSCADCPVVRALKSEREETGRVQASDGRWWLIRGIPVMEKGEITGVYEIMRDVSCEVENEKKLEEARRKLELIINNIPQRIFWKGPDLKYLGSNRWFALDAGLSSSREVVGKTDFDLSWKNDAGRYQSDDREVIRTGRPKLGYEETLKTADGETVLVRINKIPVFDDEGNITGLLGTFVNITREKQLVENLKESEERWKFALEGSGAGVWDWMVGTREAFFSPNWKKIIGFEDHEIDNLYSEFESRVHPDDLPAIYEHIDEHYRRLVDHFEVEFRMKTKSGGYKWILTRGKVMEWDEKGHPVRMMGTHTDIHHLKETQLALAYREQQLKLAMEAAKYYTFFYSSGKREMILSDNFFRDYAAESAGNEGNLDDFLKFIHPDDREGFLHALEKLPEGSRPEFYAEFRFRVGSDDYRWFGISGRQMREGRSEGSVLLPGLLTDISARKQAEQTIMQINEELEKRVKKRTAELQEAYRELESFSYSVSHDLRAPLRHIDGFAAMLRDHSIESLDDAGRQYLMNICDSAGRMERLIEDLLVFSRVGRSEIQSIQFDLDVLFSEAINEFLPEIQNRKIEWKRQSLGMVSGDPTLLRQVVYNLVSNAIKYTSKQEVAVISIGCERRDGEKIYFIRDNGVGFRMKYADKIFGVFQRLHYHEDFEGTGIGLANARKVIQRHGGRIWGEGEEGEGAVFYFTLPERT